MDKNLFLYDLAVVAILKNEARYIKEWLDYHLLAGVDHFYLYDNASSDNYNEIIAPYVAAGVVINWQLFGTNGEFKADYSRGVLERFTRRAPVDWVVPIPKRDIPGGNAQIKTVANPRKIYFFTSAHFPIYFEGNFSVNEIGGIVPNYCNEPVTAEKIALNHYNTKSREEFLAKVNKGRADKDENYFTVDWFDMYDRNEEFDDGILKYRLARADKFSTERDEQRLNRVTNALIKTFEAQEFSLESALTCRAASNFLREKFLEEASLGAILNSLDDLQLSDVRLLLSELPNLLALPYPVVKDLRGVALEIISQTQDFMRQKEAWKDFSDLEHMRRLLKLF